MWTCAKIPSRTAAKVKQNQDTLLFIYKVMVPGFFKKEQLKSSSFPAVGPCIWSFLSLQVRTAGTLKTFKTSLKTYLFMKSYNISEGPDNSNR